MTVYQYKVVPAPTRGRKAPGVKTPEARFALGFEDVLNDMGRDGWDYLRADILPSEERQGLTSSHTVYRSVLVFRRATASPEAVTETLQADATRSITPPVAPRVAPPVTPRVAPPVSAERHDPADEMPENDKT